MEKINEAAGVDLAELRKLAEAAMPGKWTHRKHGVIVAGPFYQYTNGQAQSQIAAFTTTFHEDAPEQEPEYKEANADFCAGASPEVVLALLATIESQRQVIAGQDYYRNVIDHACEGFNMSSDLRKYLESALFAPVAPHQESAA